MSRKLVTRREISNIRVHPNADALELAIIDGWQVVVKKDEFVPGDMCAFFEIDSWLPADDPRFAFLAKTGVKKDPSGRERIRLRTVKLRKELSQGLALPWTLFPELHGLPELENVDLSEHLDVIKFERPEPKVSNAAGHFPENIPKTDEERIQNLWAEYSEKYKDVEFIPTLKLDGSSCTVAYYGMALQEYWKGKSIDDTFEDTDTKIGEIKVCSRNLELAYDPESHFWKAVEGTVLDAVSDMGRLGNFAIQGEVMGPGVQGNKEKLATFDFYAFALYDIDKQEYIEWAEAKKILEEYGVKTVPDLSEVVTEPFRTFKTLDELLAFSDGPSINAKYREGIVWKSVGIEPQVSFKAISNQFLLKGGDD